MIKFFIYLQIFLLVNTFELYCKDYFIWEQLPDLPPISGQQEPLGVAGAFIGVHNNALIIAGGTNFNKPFWNQPKVWHDNIWVLVKDKNKNYHWVDGGHLDKAIAYGASVSTDFGVICLGGNNGTETFSDVFLLKWNAATGYVEKEILPRLPKPCAFSSATIIGTVVYVAGGTYNSNLESAMNNFWSLDLSKKGSDEFYWKELPSWPGPPRAFNITVAQHNGVEDCVYVISGRWKKKNGQVEFLKDVFEFSPSRYFQNKKNQNPWQRRTNIPVCVMAGPGIAVGQSHIFILGGDDGSLFHLTDSLKEKHPGFPKQAWAYHTITDTWISLGSLPANHVTTRAVFWDDAIVIPSGEVRPRVRTPNIWKASFQKSTVHFGAANFIVLILYLCILIAIGVFFSYRNKNTDDFFRGGKRVPWWVAGCSIFATMLSSITYIAIPAKAYATDWTFFLVNMAIIAIAPFIIYFILPFFRYIDATSAYEYLEKRFNLAARLFASTSFILFQIGRMAIVIFLPALALATITPMSVESCIFIIGVLSIIYCTLGGLEAVVWTDTIQTFVLLGGVLFSFVFILLNINDGISGFFSTAIMEHKFHLINWDWGINSFSTTALWVVVLGGLGQQLVTGSSDQAVIQRYMSVSDEKRAAKAIWTNAAFTFPASILFFGVGTALYVFYKHHPEKLDPTFQIDAVFPLFIGRELPVGIAGLVVAGIFAAAQSTISTSMNSIATVIVTDFIKRFNLLKTEKSYLRLARILTFAMGATGTFFALMLATFDIKSLWDSFLKILGLFGGPLCGLFMLGIFTKRVDGISALLGAFCGAIALAFFQQSTQIHFLLYAVLGITICFFTGYFFSLVIHYKKKSLNGLTIYSLKSVDKS